MLPEPSFVLQEVCPPSSVHNAARHTIFGFSSQTCGAPEDSPVLQQRIGFGVAVRSAQLRFYERQPQILAIRSASYLRVVSEPHA